MDQIDHYDMINAPQFLDFAALVENGGGYDDPETDKYFETHKEEDDFFIPIDKLQPTIQLLNEQHGNVPAAVEKVDADTMSDISVEYYNTPNGKQSSIMGGEIIRKSNTNGNETPSAQMMMSSSLTPSFHTPVGEEDKENSNYTPQSNCPNPFISTADKTLVASSRRTTASTTDGNVSQYFLRESLLAQLEKLNVGEVEEDHDNYASPENINEENSSAPTADKNYSALIAEKNNSPFSAEKNYWNANEQNRTPMLANATVVVDTPPESPQEVEIYYVRDTNQESQTKPALIESTPRPQSIYIAPSVGCEVIWDPDDLVCEYEPEPSNEDDVEDIEEANPLYRSENCLLASCANLESLNQPPVFELSPVKNLRRVSSLSDICKFLVPKNRKSTTVYGFNPRAGITIPKTPDTAKRRAGRSRVARTSSNCSSQSSIASSVASSISSVSKIPKVKADIIRKIEPISSGSRVGAYNFSYLKDRQPRAEKKTLPVNTNTYVSFAQAVASFQKNTPTRYRTAPRGGFLPKRSISVESTKRRPSPVSPHSPNLMTKQRARQTISNAQNELKKEELKLPVKAQPPLKQKLLRGAMLTLPKKIELKTTKPQPFNLTEHSRPKVVATEETMEWRFKARPAPVKILHGPGPVGVKERQQIKPTAPVELHFASEDRIRERQLKRNAQSKEPSPVRQIPPRTSRVPTRRAPSPMRPVEHKTTTVQPFSFEQRDKDLKQRKAEKLKQEEQETKKQREFHANPLPTFNSKLPKRKAAEPTHVEPFRFMSDERGAAHQAALRQKVEDEERNLREHQKFHANPAIVVKKKPFEPAKSTRPLVEPHDIQLNSDVRAQEREKFDDEIKQREQELEERRLQEEAAKEERDREYELQLRQQLVHKAKPFKNTRVFEVKASGKPLVDPKSPDFTLLPSQRRPKRLDSP